MKLRQKIVSRQDVCGRRQQRWTCQVKKFFTSLSTDMILINHNHPRPLGPDGKPIPGPAEVRQIQAARKMAQQQAQVDEVIGIMHKNVENVLERDRKLGDLEERADALQDGCAQFEKQVLLVSSHSAVIIIKS